MKNVMIVALTAALSLGFFAFASKPANPGSAGECVRAGIGTLQSLDLLTAAAKKQIDYSALANVETGPIFADLPEGSFLSLGQVVKLHTTNPELFAWCD